jgi:signal peptidase II
MVLKKSRISGNFRSKHVKIKGYYAILMFLMLIFLDRMTKTWAILNLKESKDLGMIALTYTLNTGAGFSILNDMNLLLIIISLIALAALIYYKEQAPKFSLVLILTGIVGNLIDRITYGGVVDFINLKFWPIFNLSDTMISIGVIYWIIIIFTNDRNPSENNRSSRKKRKK